MLAGLYPVIPMVDRGWGAGGAGRVGGGGRGLGGGVTLSRSLS